MYHLFVVTFSVLMPLKHKKAIDNGPNNGQNVNGQ